MSDAPDEQQRGEDFLEVIGYVEKHHPKSFDDDELAV
jgi:hypothetical protein